MLVHLFAIALHETTVSVSSFFIVYSPIRMFHSNVHISYKMQFSFRLYSRGY